MWRRVVLLPLRWRQLWSSHVAAGNYLFLPTFRYLNVCVRVCRCGRVQVYGRECVGASEYDVRMWGSGEGSWCLFVWIVCHTNM